MPSAIRTHLRDQRGFTLVELLVTAALLLIGIAGTIALIDGANARSLSSRAREGATNLQRELIERARSVPYPQLTSQGLADSLQGMPGLSDASSSPGYQVNRRGFLYTIQVSVCTRDDGKDGFGAHEAASYCAGSGTGVADDNPDDYKLVSVDVTWKSRDATGESRQQALVNNPGNAVGPVVTALTSGGYDTAPVTTEIASIQFTATTSIRPATVSWAVDGSDKGTATGSGTTWSFTWDVAALHDGTYQVSARAFDAGGRSGPGRTRTITLNRYAPRQVTGLAAGRNGAGVELEWLANPERDVIGYRVYRQVDGGPVEQVTGSCSAKPGSLTTETVCRDEAPPAVPEILYTVRALDRDAAGAIRPGTPSQAARVTTANLPPNAPTELVAAKDGAGGTVLTWKAPVPTDPDGDAIAFYRIYRDGTAYADRYDRTGSGSELRWVDARPGGQAHTYHVTAVDPQLAESTMLGPVTL
jgi:prepilin-type N-terminal cleavage/methylation domain-containing protein